MPKRVKELNRFDRGIVLQASEKDILEDTAAFSLNVDPNSKEGILSGIKSNDLIGSVGGSITRALMPWTWGSATNDNTTDGSNVFPTLHNTSLFLEDVTMYQTTKKASLSFVGTLGYPERISGLTAVPHMERLRVTPQLGNTTTSTYPVFQAKTSDVTKTATTIDMSDAQTTVDLSTLIEGEYIQFTTSTYFVGAYSNEIMKITSIDTAGNTITVERGMFNSVIQTYSTSSTYYIMVNRMSTGNKGLQKPTTKGYLTIAFGWSQIAGNHAKGNGALFDTSGTTVLKHTGATVVFDADAKTMTVNSNPNLAKYLVAGDTFTFYCSVAASNLGNRFTIKSYNGSGVFKLKETPVTETVSGSNTSYFEPGLINNATFAHKVGSGVGDGEINKVNDWTQYKLNIDSNAGNKFETSNSNSYIAQESSGLYSDTNVFGADKSADFYPYVDKSLSILAQYDDTSMNLGSNIVATDSVITISTPIYSKALFAKGDILKINNEYMQVKEVSTNGIMVERGFLNSTAGTHTAGDDILKNGMWSARNSISKDILKPDTLYDLCFWTKIKTGSAATASIVVATGAHGSLGDFAGYTITLKSTAGTIKTYKFYNSSAGDNTDIDSDGNIKIDIAGSGDINTIGTRIEAAIEHANGHNGEIAVANSSGTLTLTQAYAGEEGNTNITYGGTPSSTDLSTMNTAFTGGKSPKPVFCLDYNGGYFDENGDFQLKTISDGDDVAGYEDLTSSIPTYNIKWNPFSVCTSDFEDTISTSNIDSVKWRKISYTFRTPNEMPKNDLELNFSNFGENATAIQLAVVSLSETCFVTAETEDSPNITASSFIKHSDLQTLVMYNKTSSSLSAIENFTTHLKEPLKSITSFETSPYVENNFNSSNVSMVQKNRELHIGFGGKEQNSRPVWLGYLNSKLFNNSNRGLYLDQDAVSTYETSAEVAYSKICLAGEHESITATWDNSGTTLTVDMGSGVAHNLIAGDNITIREYLDTDNSWAGTGVWFVSALDNAAGADASRYFRCRRNTSLDVNPPDGGSMASDNNYKICWRPYYYYAIKKGTRFLYRIWPDDRISGTSASDIGTDEYVKGYTEKFLDFDFNVQSICTSYSKNGTTPDGGYVYILEENSSSIRRINVVAGYNVATQTRLTAFETITVNTKSFKWSNDNVNGDIGGNTAVYDSLAAESSPNIEHAGEFSDIIETKGPTITFDWDDTTNTNSDVSPANFDTRLWVQCYPANQNSFSTGDRFLFCGKSTYVSGANDMNFADRTPPTTTLYGDTGVKSSSFEYNTTSPALDGQGVNHYMYGYGPYADINNTNSDMLGNNDDNIQTDIKASSYFDVDYGSFNSGGLKIKTIKPFKSFNYDESKPENIEDIAGEELSTNGISAAGERYNSYINFGRNPGWHGDGSKTASIRVARYALFAVADNNCDGMLDGTGVVVPNNDNYSSDNNYGELHRKMSAHAVGMIGGSDTPWIGFGGQLNGKSSGYSIGKDNTHILASSGPLNADAPYNIDMSNCLFICTDMHFGDLPQKQKYTISSLDQDANIGGAGVAYYTKVTTSEAHYLQAGDLVYFKGNGTWPGFYSDGAPGIYSGTAAQSNKGSYTIIAVPSSTTFYVTESSAATGMDAGAQVWVGGPWMNEDNSVMADAGRTVTDLYHYAFDKDDKENNDIFKFGHFGPKWYSEQALFQFSERNMTDALIKKVFPAKSFSIERLKWEAGFLIRPIATDIDIEIDAQTSVEMPVFPDKIYHTGTTVKSV